LPELLPQNAWCLKAAPLLVILAMVCELTLTFVEPTIFSNVTSDMAIAKEEIFGPVVSVMPYENEEDAIRIANNSTYGLSGAVFTKDPEKGLALAKRIRTGNVTVNGLNLQINAPFGGYKESGIGALVVRKDWKDIRKSKRSICRPERESRNVYIVPCHLEHDPEKWKPVFRKDHAQTKS
jgi:hypothetical protein